MDFAETNFSIAFLAMGSCFSARVKAECPSSSSSSSSRSGTLLKCGNESIKDSKISSTSVPLTEGEILQSSNLKSFTLSDLTMATRNFRRDSLLGEGGFGSVYKGWIDEKSFSAATTGKGLAIAVKKLNEESFQGHREWLAEVNYLGKLWHPNLVKLIGYCAEDERRLLVYEFMPRGSLENHLFRRGTYFPTLPWSLRLKVALGAAKGLAFLHGSQVKVIYRDFKTSNILLDSDYNAKLSDFGLAKDGPDDDETHVSTRIMGTLGYAAPEYLTTGHLTVKSDVYSYGVVLLEMLSGRRAFDKNRPPVEQELVNWSIPYLVNKRKVYRVMDNRLEGQYTIEAATKVANIALHCIALKPKLRPTMEAIVKELEQLQDLNNTDYSRRERSNGSRQRRRSAGDAGGNRSILSATYPRPSPHVSD